MHVSRLPVFTAALAVFALIGFDISAAHAFPMHHGPDAEGQCPLAVGDYESALEAGYHSLKERKELEPAIQEEDLTP